MMLAALVLAALLDERSSVLVCFPEAPQSRFELPSCADEALHSALIASLKRGDRSVLPLLRQRWETADTYRERHRLAWVLIEHLRDDEAIWKDLQAQASLVLTSEDPDIRALSYDALSYASRDPRSHDLLFRALASDDVELHRLAIAGFALQKHVAALPAIDALLARSGENAEDLASLLESFESAAANEIARKYLASEPR